ncbi:hypothetical protein CkaCkLH20_09786 [Colletotrichum karsti]|uniref:CHAT domain-containing protein n=1 Tax=Colletotrichum karsti TaxID=1095194 RepID=A0A9P6HWP0_9PEZI|nr:uncharacterized protein CkaCkLH20_09786 [Colletotrichum karsti]KAF9872607.1 hypothetical protein CkaCkLH20_09786 [Colletotrichum karsti]
MQNPGASGPSPAIREALLMSMSNVREAIAQNNQSHKHPDPSIGGPTIDNDLRIAIQLNHGIATGCPDHAKADMWYLQSDMFFVKFRRSDDKKALEEAIVAIERAMKELVRSVNKESLTGKIYHLHARLLHWRFGWTRSLDDLNKGRTSGQRAYDTMPSNHPERLGLVDLLATILYEMYQATCDPDLLKRSISLTKETVEMGQEGDSAWCIATNLLASRLQAEYDRSQAVSFLNESIRQATLVLELTPSDDPELWVRRKNLGGKFLARYVGDKHAADLDLAITLNYEAREVCNSESEVHDVNLGLATLLHNRYDLTGDIADLELAIDLTEKAIGQMTDKDPHRPSYQFNLANKYWAKYEAHNGLEKTRVPTDLLDDTTKLVDFLMIGQEERLQRANISDLDKSIEFYRKAVDGLPENHLHTARFAMYTGRAYENRHCRSAELKDSDDAVFFYEKAWHASGSHLLERITGAREAAKFYTFAYPRDLEKASECLTSAVEMLPMISPRSIDDEDRQHTLRNFAGLASAAAAVALEAGREPSKALNLLEIGRGVMANLVLQLRTDTSELKQLHPQLASEFEQLRKELNPNTSESAKKLPLLTEDKRRADAEQRFRVLVQAIREKDGFEFFLLPPPVDELKSAVGDGSMVILNVSQLRCDAFLITSDGLKVLSLPRLTYEDAEKHAANLAKSPTACSSQLLEWLWDVAAGPVLNALGLRDSPGEKWPRIWWVPTGPLVHLPLHAAGYHDDGSKDTVLDRAMSSYCTSATSFSYSRRHDVEDGVRDQPGHALLVPMKKTPGMEDLKFATQEVDKVSQICESIGLDVVRPEVPKQEAVLESLRSCRIFHFAGHGQTNSKDPSQSSLHLNDKPLSVGDLRNSHLPQNSLFLAYLSACSTGANRADGLVDEGIHLISGFQLAGFRHVIGTLWQVSDRHCVPVAAEIYETLLHGQAGDEAVCKSLHRALRSLRSTLIKRDEGGKQTSSVTRTDRYAVCKDYGAPVGGAKETAYKFYWVPYVHFGP